MTTIHRWEPKPPMSRRMVFVWMMAPFVAAGVLAAIVCMCR